MTSRISFAPLAALSFLCFANFAEAQVTLRLKFTKGQTNVYDVVQDTKIAQSLLGKTTDADVKQTIEISQTVDDVLADGSAAVTTKFTRVKMFANGPNGQAEIDSAANIANDSPEAKALGAIVKMLAKIQFVATQKPTGELVNVKFPEDLIQELKTMPGNAVMGDILTEQGVKQLMSQSTLILPKESLKTGAVWNQTMGLKSPIGKMTTDMKFTYQGTEKVGDKVLHRITYIPKLTFFESDKDDFSIKIASQKADGFFLFDNELGRLQESAMNQVMEMTVDYMGQSVDQNLTQKVTAKLRK